MERFRVLVAAPAEAEIEEAYLHRRGSSLFIPARVRNSRDVLVGNEERPTGETGRLAFDGANVSIEGEGIARAAIATLDSEHEYRA